MSTPALDDLARVQAEHDRRLNYTDARAALNDDPDAWPDPLSLDALSVPPFPLDALPPVLANMVNDVARVTQTPPDLAGLMALGVIGFVCSRRVDVAIGSTHIEPLNLYCACVAESGARKGPAQRAVTAPMQTLERRLWTEKKPEIERAQQQRKIAEKHLERLSEQAAKTDDLEKRKSLTDEAAQLASELPVVAAMPKLVVSDRTTEKLELDLAEQAGALLIADEEAATLFAIAGGRYTRDGTAQLDVYLKAYDRGVIDTGRISRDLVRCQTPELSIVVTPQPILLQQLREHPEFNHRGFLPRFLFSMPRSLVGFRRHQHATAPDATVREAYATMVTRLHSLPKKADGEELPHLRIEGTAHDRWVTYADRVEKDMREGEKLVSIREWVNKQPGRVARLAGILHLVETIGSNSVESVDRATEISAHTVEAACRLGEYFEAHALAAYDVLGAVPEIEGSRRILAWMRRRKDPLARFSERDVAVGLGVGQGRFFTMMGELVPCLRLLVAYSYLRPVPMPERSGAGQKPSPCYDVHPGLLRSCRQNRQNSPSDTGERDSVESVDSPGDSRPLREPLYSTALGPISSRPTCSRTPPPSTARSPSCDARHPHGRSRGARRPLDRHRGDASCGRPPRRPYRHRPGGAGALQAGSLSHAPCGGFPCHHGRRRPLGGWRD
jgi:hypothetical protein